MNNAPSTPTAIKEMRMASAGYYEAPTEYIQNAFVQIEQEAADAALAGLAEKWDAAIRHGYERGQADERYGRGNRPEVAIALWRDEEAAQAAFRDARNSRESGR